ncbi:pilus assembly protein [Rhizobium sp. CG5]|uniref:TadE/TadG family type IV pilus assembly protein n=1 Tax=Rhizobium sp. CG5 TaxID=2726076 RepID=UPI0020342AF2|nr:TadE/TadG family type IV pilus assembly protein [Rhizobium sp. CG5]MCM2473658.1 pilus assembly protein [Rhizobium sp. CG5]
MTSYHDDTKNDARKPGSRRGAWAALLRSRDGAAAIEFAILSLPYFLIVFAILETFAAFAAEQLVANAADTMARQLRTGTVTVGLGKTTDLSETEFREAFCDEISIMITCSAEEIATPTKLYLDVREFTTFALIPSDIPVVSDVLDVSTFDYSPGGAESINMLRAYYHWTVITDLVRPYITNIRLPGESENTGYLIVATSAFQNEDYP